MYNLFICEQLRSYALTKDEQSDVIERM